MTGVYHLWLCVCNYYITKDIDSRHWMLYFTLHVFFSSLSSLKISSELNRMHSCVTLHIGMHKYVLHYRNLYLARKESIIICKCVRNCLIFVSLRNLCDDVSEAFSWLVIRKFAEGVGNISERFNQKCQSNPFFL